MKKPSIIYGEIFMDGILLIIGIVVIVLAVSIRAKSWKSFVDEHSVDNDKE